MPAAAARPELHEPVRGHVEDGPHHLGRHDVGNLAFDLDALAVLLDLPIPTRELVGAAIIALEDPDAALEIAVDHAAGQLHGVSFLSIARAMKTQMSVFTTSHGMARKVKGMYASAGALDQAA